MTWNGASMVLVGQVGSDKVQLCGGLELGFLLSRLSRVNFVTCSGFHICSTSNCIISELTKVGVYGKHLKKKQTNMTPPSRYNIPEQNDRWSLESTFYIYHFWNLFVKFPGCILPKLDPWWIDELDSRFRIRFYHPIKRIQVPKFIVILRLNKTVSMCLVLFLIYSSI